MATASDSDEASIHPRETAHKPRRGFASMSLELQPQIASKGGRSQGKANNPGNFANNRARAAQAGRKSGESQGRRTNPGNFANNRQKAAAAGRQGGQARAASH